MNVRIPTFARAFLLAAVMTASAMPDANAAEAWHTSKIKMLYPLGEGSFVLILEADSASCLSRGNPKYYYVTPGQNGVTAEGARKIYAAALLAHSQYLPVTFAFQVDSSACYINRLAVLR
jgi:hypothetical protein